VVADGEKKPLSRNGGNQLLGEQCEQNAADGGQVKVVHFEQKAELERGALAHQLPAPKDYDVVGNDCDGARLEGGEGRLALDEAEVLRLVTRNGLKRALKNGPQFQAKGTVERGDADIDPIDTHCVRRMKRGVRACGYVQCAGGGGVCVYVWVVGRGCLSGLAC